MADNPKKKRPRAKKATAKKKVAKKVVKKAATKKTKRRITGSATLRLKPADLGGSTEDENKPSTGRRITGGLKVTVRPSKPKRVGITKVIIENFKGIGQRVEIPLKPITLLFGANSSGKSTILQALLYLRELLERQNADADRLMASGAAIDLGGFEQFVHQHDTGRKVRIGVELGVDEDGLPHFGESELADEALSGVTTASIDIDVEWSPERKRPFITRFQVGINGEPFGAVRAEPGFEAKLDLLNPLHPLMEGPGENDEEPGILWSAFYRVFTFESLLADPEEGGEQAVLMGAQVIPEFGRSLPDDWSLPPSSPTTRNDFADVLDVLSRVFCGAGELVLKELKKVRYLGPTRVLPGRGFRSQRSPFDARWADGSAAWDLLYDADEDLDWFDENLLNDLGLGYRFELKRYYEVPVESFFGNMLQMARSEVAAKFFDLEPEKLDREVRKLVNRTQLKLASEDSLVEVDPADVGAGVSQVVPVVIGAMAPGYRILAIEQPELHIHPAVQCELADVFVREANRHPDRLCLIETHSEHLLLRMMKRMRQTQEGDVQDRDLKLTPDDVTVLFVEPVEGRSVYREMPLNERGELVMAWPGGFFEEDLDELM